MHEFRPPERPSRLRGLFAVVVLLVMLVPLVGLTGVLLGMTGVSYAIHDGRLVVRTGDVLFGDRTVLLSDIQDARPAELRGGLRTSGAAMPGYCIGYFSYADLGSVWQATDCSGRAIAVRAAGSEKPLVLTPPNREAFLASLRAGAESAVTLPPPEKGPLYLVVAVLIPAAVVAVSLTAALFLFGPSRMRYVVGDGALEVKTLYGRKRFALQGATAKAYRPSRLWRIAGSALPGYSTGIFREGGLTTRVYATDLKDTVLVEGGMRVIVSPRNREGFLAALHAEGARVQGHGD